LISVVSVRIRETPQWHQIVLIINQKIKPSVATQTCSVRAYCHAQQPGHYYRTVAWKFSWSTDVYSWQLDMSANRLQPRMTSNILH